MTIAASCRAIAVELCRLPVAGFRIGGNSTAGQALFANPSHRIGRMSGGGLLGLLGLPIPLLLLLMWALGWL
jgi:hypothetical protein